MQTKQIIIAIVVLAAIAAGLIYGKAFLDKREADKKAQEPMKAEVAYTPLENNAVVAPKGLPSDLPIEKGSIIESATTNYPDQNATQLSISYESAKSLDLKYAEYKSYMEKAGYKVSEGEGTNPRSIFGSKEGANLSVVISTRESGSLVQIAYLNLKP